MFTATTSEISEGMKLGKRRKAVFVLYARDLDSDAWVMHISSFIRMEVHLSDSCFAYYSGYDTYITRQFPGNTESTSSLRLPVASSRSKTVRRA